MVSITVSIIPNLAWPRQITLLIPDRGPSTTDREPYRSHDRATLATACAGHGVESGGSSTQAGASCVPDPACSPLIREDGQGLLGSGVLGDTALQPVRCLDEVRGAPGDCGVDVFEQRPLVQAAFRQFTSPKDPGDPT